MVCPRCGSSIDGKRFCSHCGLEIHQPPTTPVSPAAIPTLPSNPPASAQPAFERLQGRTLNQKYQLETPLGMGGMGTVYRAKRLLIGDTAAVKVLHQAQVGDPQAVERFRREAQAAARLKHPNVVAIYDAGVSDEGLCYFVMELVEGRDLRAIIKQQGPLTQSAAAEIIRQVGSALDEAHRHNIVHRDLKPENIVVQQTPMGLQVKVLDFGIASIRDATTSRLTHTGQMLGTPHYMSPEQCMGEELDGRSDVYSLGVVLFEMLTGIVPFNSPTPTAIVVQHVNQQPPPLRAHNASISPAVEAIVLRALAKRREDRPQTAGALALELLTAVNVTVSTPSRPTLLNTPAPEPAPTMGVPTSSWSDNDDSAPLATAPGGGKLVPLLVGLLLLIVAAGGLGYWWLITKPRTSQSGVTTSPPVTLLTPSPTAAPSPPPVNFWQALTDQTKGTSDVENALGEPDEKSAVIEPGGELALAYQAGQFFGNGTGADLRVFGVAQTNASYLIFVRDDPAAVWQRVDVNRRGFPPGGAEHDIGHHGIAQARQVMIRNTGNAVLSIDAVVAVYKDKVPDAPEHHHSH